MHEILISIRNKIAVNAEPKRQVVVCGNSDYSIKFSFDAEWDEFNTKTARFAYNGQYKDVVFNGNVCPVPVMKDVHGFTVGVYSGNLHTTTPATVYAKKSVLCEDGLPADPAVPSVYTQIMEAVGGKANSNHTHSYNDLTNKPDIPEAYDDAEVKGMIAGKADADHTHSYNDLTDIPENAGSYDDTDIRQAIAGKADADHVHSYNDLTDRPVIPSAYDDTALSVMVANKIDKPSETPVVGKVLRVKEVLEDGSFVCEWADAGSGSSVDVQINGTSITQDGVANIPLATNSVLGVSKFNSNSFQLLNGAVYVPQVKDIDVDNRNSAGKDRQPLTVRYVDYAVKAAMCDGKGTAWTADEQAAAQQRIGINKEWVLKGTMTGTDATTVDLSGCTEMIFVGSAKGGSSHSNINIFVGNTVSSIISATIRQSTITYVYARFATVNNCIEPIVTKYGSSETGIQTSSIASIGLWKSVCDVTSFKFNNNLPTDVNIQIYAR